MSTAAVNPYEIPMEELAALAAAAPATEVPTDPPADPGQPRDENGRFVAVADPAADPAQDDPAAAPNPAPVEEFTATIDIGDGSGIQVFSAATKDELLEKLITAQENATRKIRELTQAPPAPPAPPVVEAVNLDDEAALAQAIISEPSAAIRKILEKELGMSVAEAKAKINAAAEMDAVNKAQEAGRSFVAATPDYYACPDNEARMIKYLTTYRMPNTVESIREAFTELNSSGLLSKKPAVTDPTPAPPRARASGLSTRNSAPPVVTVEDPLKKAREMPLNELFALAGGYAKS